MSDENSVDYFPGENKIESKLGKFNNKKRFKKKKFSYNKKIHCSNCGKCGHIYKNCHDPITSLGIINMSLDIPKEEIETFNLFVKTIKNQKNPTVNSDGIRCDNVENDIQIFNLYGNVIKFLMIRRKHTLGYMEFMRGHYRVSNVDGIVFLFRQMVIEEIENLTNKSFDTLWEELWVHKGNTNYEKEYEQSKKKFNRLKFDEDVCLNLDFFINNVKPMWNHPEWGFPKGKRNFHETDTECAQREFIEESGFRNNEFAILDNIKPLEENLTGTDGRKYRHIYYISVSKPGIVPFVDPDNLIQSSEIGEIGWFTFNEAYKLIRPHHKDKIRLLSELFMFAVANFINMSKNSVTLQEPQSGS